MNLLTVAIVNYNSKEYLSRCLASLFEQTRTAGWRIVVVDNDSEDRDFSELQDRYPDLQIILNSINVGFSRACNQAVRRCPARFYLLLNPDCLILDRAVDRALSFLLQRPEAGIVGCRVNNPDGTLQLACRRSIPRPSTALYRLLGLSQLFPRSPRFGRYNLSFLDENTTHEVEAVSGSFLLFRHELIDQIGLLDEDFFMYGEDLDFCYRAARRGWKIYYFPEARVIHYKRRSSSQSVRRSTFHYYDAMEIFYRKHFRSQNNGLQAGLIRAGIRLLHLQARARRLILGKEEVGSDR